MHRTRSREDGRAVALYRVRRVRIADSRRSLTRSLPSPVGWWLVGLGLFGVAARVGFYLSPFGVPEADEAVGGLMARHALHGEWLSVFYWGQAYGGPLETWLAAPLLALTGPSWLALRLVPMVLTVAATAVVWRVALRIANPLAAAAAAGVMLFFPSTLIWKTIHFHIFYASALLLGCPCPAPGSQAVGAHERRWDVPARSNGRSRCLAVVSAGDDSSRSR